MRPCGVAINTLVDLINWLGKPQVFSLGAAILFLLELIILFDFYIWQGPIRIFEVPMSSEHPFTGRFRAFKFFRSGIWRSCFDPHIDFPEIGFVFRVVNAQQWRQ